MKITFTSDFCPVRLRFLLLMAEGLLTSYISFAQLPDCDIWLLDIKDSAGQISFHNPANITNRKGYDNQPAFSPDGKYILYSSQHNSGGSTDIYKYDLATKQTIQFTKIPESEYAPTFMPEGKHISTVVVEKDSTQRLWSFEISPVLKSPTEHQKKNHKLRWPGCIMDKVKEIGYHCWINEDSVAIYVLTKPAFTLQIANVHTQNTSVIADSIGRCMKMHDGNLWYTAKAGNFWNVYEYSFKTQTSYIKGMIESEDFLLRGKYEIWSCSDNAIVSDYINSKAGANKIVNFESFGITKPTRIAISPDGKKLAVVSNK